MGSFNQDLAGVGGDVRFVRETADVRRYYAVLSDIVGVLHLQAGTISGWGNGSSDFGQLGATGVRMLDNFQMGPNLVRGFAPAGIGPRDLTFGTTNDALGGTITGARSSSADAALTSYPRKWASRLRPTWTRARCGTIGARHLTLDRGRRPHGMVTSSNTMFVNSAAGVGLLWASPFGPIRFDLAYPITKTLLRQDADFPVRRRHEFLTAAGGASRVGPRAHDEAFFFPAAPGLSLREIAALYRARNPARHRSRSAGHGHSPVDRAASRRSLLFRQRQAGRPSGLLTCQAGACLTTARPCHLLPPVA